MEIHEKTTMYQTLSLKNYVKIVIEILFKNEIAER
jgi:hypothetical protein